MHDLAYHDELMEIRSERELGRIQRLETLLAEYPDLGSPLVRPSFVERFGEGIRTYPVGSHTVFYRHEGGVVRMCAVVSSRTIR